jgi:hypothetical protein
VPLLKEDKKGDWRKTTHYHFYPYPGMPEHYGIRSKNYKLHHFPDFGDGNYWEFFSLDDDSKELKNEYNKPENLEIIEEMKEELRKHRQAIGIIP